MDMKEHVKKLQDRFGGSMSNVEVEFLRDIQGFIDFAIRNQLSLPIVISTLGHDINGLVQYGMDLAEARKLHGFLPQVAGYSEITEDSIGQPDEPE